MNYALRRAVATHERIGQIRQRGLAVGIPVKDRDGNEEPGYLSREDANRMCAHAIENSRVLLRPLGNVITIVPPLNIETEQIDEIVNAIAKSLEVLDKPAE